MNQTRPIKLLDRLQRFTWAAFLLALPVTSFPFFPPAVGGEALVRPLSIYPLLILIAVAVLPRLFTRPLPRTLLSLLPFVFVALASSLISLLSGIEPALGISVNARVLRGVFTLAIGCAVYLTVALLPESEADLAFSLRWILIGCALALFWGSLQAVYIIHFDERWFSLLSRMQEFISTRRLLPDRISGLTYEPHWFAEQINVLLVPAALAGILNRRTVFPWRWKWLTVEWLLMGWAIALLPFTYSRSGVLNLILLTSISVLIIRLKHARDKSSLPAGLAPARQSRFHHLLEAMLVLLVLIVPIYLIGQKNQFFARLWEYWQHPEQIPNTYLSYLGLDARLVFNEAAYNTYQAHPFLGVGLGNYAFYFEEMLPYRPLSNIPEVLLMITPEPGRDRLVTAKNLYLRLLAETGMLGTAAFFAFLIANLGCALFLWLSPRKISHHWGAVSLCGFFAISLSAFTYDSFVIPNMWVMLGIISAAPHVLGRQYPEEGL
ncbi:MAG: O-antigen ligase family protein [Anaerolineales bacterium]|nr:O-antigen ligase family protein [Anaerolineales bacterium]